MQSAECRVGEPHGEKMILMYRRGGACSSRQMQSKIQRFYGTPGRSSPTIIITISHIIPSNIIENSTFFGRIISSPTAQFEICCTAERNHKLNVFREEQAPPLRHNFNLSHRLKFISRQRNQIITFSFLIRKQKSPSGTFKFHSGF